MIATLVLLAGLMLTGLLTFGTALLVRNHTNTEKTPGLRRRVFASAGVADPALIDVGHALSLAVVVAVIIVGAVVALQVLSSLFPTYSGAVKNLSSNMTTADWGNTTANSLGPIFGLLISLAGIFAILGLVFIAVEVKHLIHGRGGGKA